MRNGIAPLTGRSPLGTAEGAAGKQLVVRPDLLVVEEPLLPVYSLRLSRKQGRGTAEGFAGACGLRLPAVSGGVDGNAELGLAWIEPNAWLLLGGKAASTVAGVELPRGVYLTELTARFCVIRIDGSAARQLLASAVSLDLTDQGFADARCARTPFGELGGVYLQRIGSSYRLAIDTALGPCLADWLADAARMVGSSGFQPVPSAW